VDTGPVLERAHGARAGLGWIGKNTCLIDPELGSYLLLGVVITDLALRASTAEPGRCGTCRACLDACPTRAFDAPHVLDATRCLSYATIEQRGAIPVWMREAQGSRVFGCDVCQEVCPWNSHSRRKLPADPLGLRERLAPRAEWRGPSLEWLLSLDEENWRRATRKTALRRPGLRGLLRNALVAAGNSGDPALIPALRRHAMGDDPLLADHAEWALDRLSELGA
jgi:epoxyqueuosine reductase